ncbi:unnamed protein product, partial [Iphiclides podalirius]
MLKIPDNPTGALKHSKTRPHIDVGDASGERVFGAVDNQRQQSVAPLCGAKPLPWRRQTSDVRVTNRPARLSHWGRAGEPLTPTCGATRLANDSRHGTTGRRHSGPLAMEIKEADRLSAGATMHGCICMGAGA